MDMAVDGRTDEATSDLNGKLTKEQVEALLDRERAVYGTGGDVATFKVTLQAPAGATNCTLTLTKEGGAWKVHHLSIP